MISKHKQKFLGNFFAIFESLSKDDNLLLKASHHQTHSQGLAFNLFSRFCELQNIVKFGWMTSKLNESLNLTRGNIEHRENGGIWAPYDHNTQWCITTEIWQLSWNHPAWLRGMWSFLITVNGAPEWKLLSYPLLFRLRKIILFL